MRRLHVESTTIGSMGYDTRRRELDIEFLESGHIYRYSAVSADEYTEFMAADSKGTYLNQIFKPKNHPYRLIKKGKKRK
jgi:hypothetical protein